MQRELERVPGWVLTQAYVLALLAARLLGDPGTEPGSLFAALAVSGLFLLALLVRRQRIRPILNILFIVAAIVAVIPMPDALRFAIVLCVPSTLVYLCCDRQSRARA